MNKNESQQIGKLIGKVEGINQRLDRFNGQIGDLAKSVNGLPCERNDVRIKLLEKGQNNNVTARRLDKSIKGGIKAQILGGLIGAGVTGIIWLVYTLLSH